jgi:hypothetical protein
VEFGAFVSRIKRKSLIISLFLTWYCFCIHLYVTICMKLDPGMHIVMHLVFFGKTGVTSPPLYKLWLWMCLYAIWFVNLGLALCSVKLVTLKEKIVGEIPSFTNHARH